MQAFSYSCTMHDIDYHLRAYSPFLLLHDRDHEIIRSIQPFSSISGVCCDDILYFVDLDELPAVCEMAKTNPINIVCLSNFLESSLDDSKFAGVNLIFIRNRSVSADKVAEIIFEAMSGKLYRPSPHEELLEALNSPAKNALVCAIERLFRNPVYIRDTSLELIGTSVEGHRVTADNFSEQFFSTPSLIEAMNTSTKPLYLENDRTIYIPVYIGKILVAHVFVHLTFTAFADEDLIKADAVAKAIAIHLQKTSSYQFKSGFSNEFLMLRLLNQNTNSQVYYPSYLKNINLSLYDHLHIMTFNLPESYKEGSGIPGKIVSNDLSNICKSALSAIYEEHLVLLLTSKDEPALTKSQMDEITAYIERRNIQAAVSIGFTDLIEIPKRYRQTLSTLSIAQLLKKTGGIFFARDMFPYLMMSAYCDQNISSDCISQKVRKILDYDRDKGTTYYTTLLSVVKNGCDFKKAAIEFSLHRNTIQYRVEKIQELFNVDMKKDSDCLDILLSEYAIELERAMYPNSDDAITIRPRNKQ